MSRRLPPATLGLIGGGQLGQMIGLSAIAIGYRVVVLDPSPNCPAAAIADAQLVAAYDDAHALAELNALCDIITYEFENADPHAIASTLSTEKLPQGVKALSVAQHRLREKALAEACGIPTPTYTAITTPDELMALTSFPVIVKTCRFGYDGKGQWLIQNKDDLRKLSLPFPAEYIAETKIDFTQEIAVTVARFVDGTTAFDPIATVHEKGILRSAISPATLNESLRDKALAYTQSLAHALDYIGVLCVEYFVQDDTLYFNEIAPRPHNSAHATIEGYSLSQYDLHLLAITGSPCVPTRCLQSTYLENILGQDEPMWRTKALAVPQAHIHLYGKHDIRPGRKLGHVVLAAATKDALTSLIESWRNA